MATTPRSTLDRPAAHGSLTVSSFDRARTPRTAAARRLTRRPGASPVLDPRRDLQMFALEPAPRAAQGASVDELAPLLPPVISEPPRSRRPVAARPAPAHRSERAQRARERHHAAASRRTRVRLTLRGYSVLLGLVVACIAATSALTNASVATAVSVPAAEVVVQPGESLHDVAARAADGRSVDEVLTGIRQANGLPGGAQPEAGEILLVPGS